MLLGAKSIIFSDLVFFTTGVITLIINELKLKTILVNKRMKAIDLANLTGISPSTISNILRGLNCSDKTAKKIADALGCSTEDFMGGVKNYVESKNQDDTGSL